LFLVIFDNKDMTKNTIISIILVIIVLAAIIFSVTRKSNQDVNVNSDSQEQNSDINSNINNSQTDNKGVVFGETETAVRMKVVEFGRKLKNVSILAADYKNQLQTQYGAYVTPALLMKWKADSSLALGRTTSSPWPDRIEIVSVTKQNETTYKVEGNVIEVNADQPVAAVAVYPVTITVQLDRGVWLITNVVKGAYTKMPEKVTMTGIWECLPHKNASGPQTLECAFGIKADNGKHYAVSLQASIEGAADSIPTNSRVRVEGMLSTMNTINTDMWQKYNIEGIISASKIQKI
jgi:type II secretory pathway pseudopilin PulG